MRILCIELCLAKHCLNTSCIHFFSDPPTPFSTATEMKESSCLRCSPQNNSTASDSLQEELLTILFTILSRKVLLLADNADSYFLRCRVMAVAPNIHYDYFPACIQWYFDHCTSQAPAAAYP
jgi:hypothetical protein